MAITYTPTTNFGAKDSLPTNDPDKVIKGSEFTTEFTALQTAFSLAAPNASPTFTGTVTIPTADINGGAIDGTVIGGASAAAGTFTNLTASGTVSFSGATVSNGGAVTTIDINGGNIDGTVIGGATPAAGSFTTGQFDTSLNVDGTVTADGLTVEPSASTGFTVGADGTNTFVNFEANSIAASVQQYYGQAAGTAFYAVGAKDSGGTLRTAFRIDGGGDISFYEDTGTTPKFFWDASAESLGIGTTSPVTALDVRGEISVDYNATYGLRFYNQGRNNWSSIGNDDTSTGADLVFKDSTGAVMRITGGNVGIGESSPSGNCRLHVTDADVQMELEGTNGANSGFINFDGTNLQLSTTRDMKTGAFRNTGKSNATLTLTGASGGSTIRFYTASADNTAGTERMRLDSSGNFLVGKTSNTFSTSGFSANANGMSATRSAGPCVQINRTTSDGDIAEFYKDGTIVGSIGTAGGGFYLGNAASLAYANIRFTNNEVFPCQSNAANNDDAIDLGKSNSRWRDIYAGNGTINTSDANEKQDIAELDEAERRVAVACKGLLRKFRWKSSVAEKGDEARIHFGIIAQDLQAAFEAEGLDAGRYGMFIHSTWTDEETGEERSRMGVRYSELLAFIIAAL